MAEGPIETKKDGPELFLYPPDMKAARPAPAPVAEAVLPGLDRALVTAQWMRDNKETCAFRKNHLASAVAACDNWLNANFSAYNTALPSNFRTTATSGQKDLVLAYVGMRRAGILQVEGA